MLCISSHVSAETGLPAKYNPVKISGMVETRPGTASWSPDGKRVAFISTSLNIYDTKNSEQKKIPISKAYYVSWSANNELFILYRENGRKTLCKVDAMSFSIKKINLEIEPDAVFPAMDGRRLLILASEIKALSIGHVVNYSLNVYDTKKGNVKNIYTYSRILPKKYVNADYLSGWTQQNINPFDTTTLIMEYINPPAVAHYVKVIVDDYVTGKTREIGRMEHKYFSVSGSWSPDGRRIAFPDMEGHLTILDSNGPGVNVDSNTVGIYPSWNPKGSQIFFGGHIINSDGKDKEEILQSGAKSIALWSPDGNRMAMLYDNGLWLLEGFRPYFIPPDRPLNESIHKKVLVLKDLLSEGLLTEEEYFERYDKISKEEAVR